MILNSSLFASFLLVVGFFFSENVFCATSKCVCWGKYFWQSSTVWNVHIWEGNNKNPNADRSCKKTLISLWSGNTQSVRKSTVINKSNCVTLLLLVLCSPVCWFTAEFVFSALQSFSCCFSRGNNSLKLLRLLRIYMNLHRFCMIHFKPKNYFEKAFVDFPSGFVSIVDENCGNFKPNSFWSFNFSRKSYLLFCLLTKLFSGEKFKK